MIVAWQRSVQRALVRPFGAEVTVERAPEEPTVIVINGDPVVSKALALLLQTASYDVRFASRSSLEDPAATSRLLEGAQLALVTPGMVSEHYERVLGLLQGGLAMGSVPVLQLGASPDGVQARADYIVPWPCRIEDLRRQIDAALLAGDTARGSDGEVRERREG